MMKRSIIGVCSITLVVAGLYAASPRKNKILVNGPAGRELNRLMLAAKAENTSDELRASYWFSMGVILRDNNKQKAAKNLFKKVYKTEDAQPSKRIQAAFYIGTICEKSGDKAAEIWYEKAVEIKCPEDDDQAQLWRSRSMGSLSKLQLCKAKRVPIE